MATLRLPYVCASGRESVEISSHDHRCGGRRTLGDETGLHRIRQRFGRVDDSRRGGGDACGCRGVRNFADGVSVGSCRANVISDPDAVPEGLPVGWNFYALGMTGTAPRGSEWDYSWTTDAIHPATDTNPLDAHRLLPTAGNENAYLTASGVVSDNGNYTFNPGIPDQGADGERLLPLRHSGQEHQGGAQTLGGASMGAAGFRSRILRARIFGRQQNVWMLAEGSTLMEVFGTSAQVHYYVPKGEYQRGSENLRQVHRQGVSEIRLPQLTGMETIYEGQPLPASAHLHGPSCQRLRKHEKYDRLGMGRSERLRSRPGRRINSHRASPRGIPGRGALNRNIQIMRSVKKILWSCAVLAVVCGCTKLETPPNKNQPSGDSTGVYKVVAPRRLPGVRPSRLLDLVAQICDHVALFRVGVRYRTHGRQRRAGGASPKRISGQRAGTVRPYGG